MMPPAPQSSAGRPEDIAGPPPALPAEAYKIGDAADVLYGFKIEAAVFGIDEGPLKARGQKNTRNLR